MAGADWTASVAFALMLEGPNLRSLKRLIWLSSLVMKSASIMATPTLALWGLTPTSS